mgnify:CR=1 FL=1
MRVEVRTKEVRHVEASQNVGKHMSFDQIEVGVSLSRCDIRHDKW